MAIIRTISTGKKGKAIESIGLFSMSANHF